MPDPASQRKLHDRPPETASESFDPPEPRVHPMSIDPFAWVVIPFLIPAGLVFVLWSLAVRLRAVRRLRSRAARCWLGCSLVAHALYAYAALLLSILSADVLLGISWRVAEWWPLLWRWEGSLHPRIVLLLLESMVALLLALVALAVARAFGYLDEEGRWWPANWRRSLGSSDMLDPDQGEGEGAPRTFPDSSF